MSDWQPIETAPKGERILIISDNRRHYIVTWGVFYSDFYRSEMAGWWGSSDPEQDDLILPDEATHWMPLPEPPSAHRDT